MRRIPELDALRGIAAIAIVLYHLRPHRLPFGWAAVDLFFVLSGYLITCIALKARTTNGFLMTFYIRRGLRIWPIYYLVLVALWLLNPWVPEECKLGSSLPYYAAYVQNIQYYWFGDAPGALPLGHTWSLAIEEQFYLLWPLLLCFAKRSFLVPILVATVALAVTARAVGFNLHLLVTRADALALGGILAVAGSGNVRLAHGKLSPD